MKRKRPDKRPYLLMIIKERLEADLFITTVHALDRQSQRFITFQQIKYALLHGYHEKIKDTFDEAFSAWNYAIRGETFDGVNLRVIVSFDAKDDLLIITAFEIGNDKDERI